MLVYRFTKDCSSQLIWWEHAKHPLNDQLYGVHFLVDSAQPYAKLWLLWPYFLAK